MPNLSPKEAAEKWAQRAAAAVPDYKRGVDRVTESPMAKAAKSVDKLMANFMEAVTSGRWAASLENVSLEEWKRAASEKGAARLAQGVQGAVGKQTAYYEKAFPFIERLQREIASMPNLTIEDSIARAAHMMRSMHEFKKTL